MTISTLVRKVFFEGNGVATVYPYAFKVAVSTNLKVYFLIAGTWTLQSTGGYSVSGVGTPSGGNVTFTAAPPAATPGTANVLIVRKTPLVQAVDYVANDAFPAETHEGALDLITAMVQDTIGDALQWDPATNSWAAGALKITGVANPTAAQDAVTKDYGDTNYGGASVIIAAASATAASNSATAASNSATAASNSATAASNSATAAAASAAVSAASRAEGAAVVSAGTIDIWATDGDTKHITGATGPITSMGAAPQAGVWVDLIFDSTPTLTQGANLNLNAGDANIVIEAGDSARVYADTTTQLNVFVTRKSGAAVAALAPAPTGSIVDFGGTAVPSGYLACDGANVSRTTYAGLFAAISTTWGVGDGSTTFNLPDLRRRTIVGSGGTGTARLGNAVGNTGGVETHTLTTAELAVHGHRVSGGTDGGGLVGLNIATQRGFCGLTLSFGYSANTGGGIPHIESSGSGSAHNNMQPSAVVLKIIKT